VQKRKRKFEIHDMRHIQIARDDVGREFIYQLDKNHRADATGSVTEGRMYALPGHGQL
jgi:hypothetical protein